MTTAITSTDLCKAAESAAPGRVTYDLARSQTITIASTDGESEIRVGLTEDPVNGGDCVLSVLRRSVENEGRTYWEDEPSDVVDSIDELAALIAALG